jgi:hypothetical protein
MLLRSLMNDVRITVEATTAKNKASNPVRNDLPGLMKWNSMARTKSSTIFMLI